VTLNRHAMHNIGSVHGTLVRSVAGSKPRSTVSQIRPTHRW
jgi:hypothetical protein